MAKKLQESHGGVLQIHYDRFLSESETPEESKEARRPDGLVWARLVKEEYGGKDAAYIFLVSPIAEDSKGEYQRICTMTS